MGEISAEYRASKLHEELRGNWVNALIHRLPCFGFVWLFARLEVSPMAVTIGSGVVALSLPLLASQLPLGSAAIAVCLAGTLFQILDCTDGALARITRTLSPLGARVDFLIDMAQWGLLYLAIGLLADRTLGSQYLWTGVALGAAWLRLYARMLRDSASDQGHDSANQPLRPAEIPVAFIAGLSGAIPFLALAGDWLGAATVFLLAYAILDLGETIVSAFARPTR